MSNTIERRFTSTKLEFRSTAGDEGALFGTAASFNRLSSDLGGFRERLAPGCFRKALAHVSAKDVYLCQDHNPSLILGRVSANNLTLGESKDGLLFHCNLPKTQLAADIRELVSKGILSECSFAFMVPDGGDSWDEEDIDSDLDSRNGNSDLYANRKVRCTVRTVREIMPLIDCSIVANPAYGNGATSAHARNLFPNGLPVSIRSHVKDNAALQSYARQQRRNLTNVILG